MFLQTVHVLEIPTLYKILNEIKENFSFKISNFEKIEDFLESLKQKKIDLDNSAILINENKMKFIQSKINKRNIFITPNFPIDIQKLVEKINIQLIKQKYNIQSNFNIKQYFLNINSRILSKENNNLKLTEKEIDIILFLYKNKKTTNVSVLQKEVWGYSPDLETHTVETHIYRLRKKIKDGFKDENFILSQKEGYLIK
tara:strand:- start:573 stop:1169 length:597 start_codon:yes stop_codon:yes gene_type:complete